MKFGTGEYGSEMRNFILPENQTDLLRKYCGLENFTPPPPHQKKNNRVSKFGKHIRIH
jgi:hypothetical protein